jgi:hypothetical protein
MLNDALPVPYTARFDVPGRCSSPPVTLQDGGGIQLRMFDNRLALQRGDHHFRLPIGGKRVVYAYIRKNACSAFKRAAGLPSSAHVGQLVENFRWRLWQPSDAAIFVYRDPVERLVSLYRNKILDGDGNSDILHSYESIMNEEPSSFERFVEFAVLEADPHCIPQYRHLKPIRYTHAIAIDRLHEIMTSIVGEEAAEPFRHKVNSSRPTPVDVSDRALSMIVNHYASDYRMIDRINRSR